MVGTSLTEQTEQFSQTTYQAQDLKQVIASRIKVLFPNLKLNNNDLKDFFMMLLDPPIANANPEENIPVYLKYTASAANPAVKNYRIIIGAAS